MKRLLLGVSGFLVLVLGLTISLSVFRARAMPRLEIPRSLRAISYFPSSKIVLTGPLMLPRSLAANVLGLAHVSPEEVVLFVNNAREKADARKLSQDPLLVKAAAMRAETILKHENFSHSDPYEHIQLDTIVPKVGYTFSYLSENIGLGEQDAESFVNGFLSSPPHKQNLLDSQLVDTGVGVVQGKFRDREVTIVVQIFGVPAPVFVARGYSDGEEANLKSMLSGLNDNLSRTEGYLAYNSTSTYYLGWKNLLERQIKIVEEVLSVVEKKEPYTDKERQLIAEYNQNWNLAPR